MNTAIIYVSTHHGNTKKLVDAVASEYDVDVYDGTGDVPDLGTYDCIGLAAGIAFGKFYP